MNQTSHLSTEALSAYLDQEASESERQSTATHLESCAPCRDRFEQLQQLVRRLRQQPIPAAPEGLRTRIARAVSARPRGTRWILAAAAAVAGVAVMLILFDRRPEPIPQDSVQVTDSRVESESDSPSPPPPSPPPPRERSAIEQPAAKDQRQNRTPASLPDVVEQTLPSDYREQLDERTSDTASSAAPLAAKEEATAPAAKRREATCVMLPTTFLVRNNAGATGFSRWFEKRTGYAPEVESFSSAEGYTYQVPRAIWERYKGEPLAGLAPEVSCVRFRVQLVQ